MYIYIETATGRAIISPRQWNRHFDFNLDGKQWRATCSSMYFSFQCFRNCLGSTRKRRIAVWLCSTTSHSMQRSTSSSFGTELIQLRKTVHFCFTSFLESQLDDKFFTKISISFVTQVFSGVNDGISSIHSYKV
jgi:hypothetical protein